MTAEDQGRRGAMKNTIAGILGCLDAASSETEYHNKVAKLAEALGRYLGARDVYGARLVFPEENEPQRYTPSDDETDDVIIVYTASGDVIDLVRDPDGKLCLYADIS